MGPVGVNGHHLHPLLEEQWQKWQALPAATRRGVLATLMLLDGGIGLLYGSSLLDLGIGGDLLWLSQSVEFIIGGLLLLHAVVERLTGNYRTAAITAIPLIILLVLGACFELLFSAAPPARRSALRARKRSRRSGA